VVGASSPQSHRPLCLTNDRASATRFYAPKALKAVDIEVPAHIVMAEDVSKGKPHPDPYLRGAKNLGLDPVDGTSLLLLRSPQLYSFIVVVFEDAPSGVVSGRTAGMTVIAVSTSHTTQELIKSAPDYIVKDLSA